MDSLLKQWQDALGFPSAPCEKIPATLICTYNKPTYTLELYRQPLENGTSQRVMLAIPKSASFPTPAVLTPFYFPEAMLGYDPATEEALPKFAGIEMLAHLAERGYIAACADAYHLTCHDSEKSRDDFTRWRDAAAELYRQHPHWSGMGKLVSDTVRMLDLVSADPRVDATRIGIAGHSLGGKMAFYTGCLDERIKVMVASDFGFGWEQSNWDDPWYWNGKVDTLQKLGLHHTNLLSLASPKPFCLLAGEYDDAASGVMMREASGYKEYPHALKLVHHGKGHRPPADALEEGYAFLDTYLK